MSGRSFGRRMNTNGSWSRCAPTGITYILPTGVLLRASPAIECVALGSRGRCVAAGRHLRAGKPDSLVQRSCRVCRTWFGPQWPDGISLETPCASASGRTSHFSDTRPYTLHVSRFSPDWYEVAARLGTKSADQCRSLPSPSLPLSLPPPLSSLPSSLPSPPLPVTRSRETLKTSKTEDRLPAQAGKMKQGK